MKEPLQVVLQWGIGNRVNGLINGLILSQLQQRPVRFYWRQGKHCQASFTDIFHKDPSSWLGPLGYQGADLVPGWGEDAICLPRTLFCPPNDEYARLIRQLVNGISYDIYAIQYQSFWSALRWSDEVRTRLHPQWKGIALNVRANRKLGDYAPVSANDLASVTPGAFIACDSEYWKQHYLDIIPGSFGLPTNNGDTDLSGRDRDGFISAAADLLMIASASVLHVHAPLESTFSIPATFGAQVPTVRIVWRRS